MKNATFQNENEIIKIILSGKLTTLQIIGIERSLRSVDRYSFKPLLKRIYDLNEDIHLNRSTADSGLLGFMNRIGRRKRTRRFKKALKKKDLRNNTKIIVAEGDSWFEYPIFITEIVDWVMKLKKYPVYSLAMGGDWIGNILYENEYITELTNYAPEAFLISGGGNDIVGGGRLATLVHKYNDVKDITEVDQNKLLELEASYCPEMAEKIIKGYKFLNKDFWALLNVFRFQYFLIFNNIKKSKKFPGMKIITQGYDFGIPSNNKNIFKNPLRLFFGNGRWLYYPLCVKGIYEKDDQYAIICALIHEFNEMLIDLGSRWDNVYHIDCRGYAKENYWADELHLFSRHYKSIAEKYIECINAKNPKKVYRVK